MYASKQNCCMIRRMLAWLQLPGLTMVAAKKPHHHPDLSIVVGKLDKIYAALKLQEKRIMATLAEVQAKIAAVAVDIAAEKAEVQAAITDLKAQIQALQDQIGSGSVVTAADLDALVSALDTMSVAVKDISEPVVA